MASRAYIPQSTHAMDERKQESWHLNGKENNDGEGRQIWCERTYVTSIIVSSASGRLLDICTRGNNKVCYYLYIHVHN